MIELNTIFIFIITVKITTELMMHGQLAVIKVLPKLVTISW
jgi:hypothetical protein